MTNIEILICQEAARRFIDSKSAQLRIQVERVFARELSAGPDRRESFLEALENLARLGIFSLQWKRFREGEELSSISLIDSEALFKRLNLPHPLSECASAREAALAIAGRAGSAGDAGTLHDSFNWLADALEPSFCYAKLRPLSLSKRLMDLDLLLQSQTIYAPRGFLEGISLRALSIKLFSNSKYIEELLTVLAPLLRRMERAGFPLPNLDAFDRAFPETYISGALRLVLDDNSERYIDNAAGHILGLSLQTASAVRAILPLGSSGPLRLISVENKETFIGLASKQAAVPGQAYLYTAGHPNRVVQLLLACFAASGFALSHAGDLDIEGILILQELIDIAGRPILPLCMDASTFRRYWAFARPLEPSMLNRAAFIRPETRNIVGISELIDLILASASGLEQEIIDYP